MKDFRKLSLNIFFHCHEIKILITRYYSDNISLKSLENKQLNTKSVKEESNILFYFGIGFFIFIFMIFILFSTKHFEKIHTTRINKLNKAKPVVNFISLKYYYAIPKKNNAAIIEDLANTKNGFSKLIEDKHWFSSFDISSKQQQNDIHVILKQLQLFEQLIINREKSLDSIHKFDKVFHSLQSNIASIEIDLNKRFLHHQNILHYTRMFTILSLLLLITVVLFIATKKKKIRERLLKKAKLTNSFLQESHQISKLIAYSYDFKTKFWETSGSFKNLIGTELYANSMRFWIERIHPDDKEKIISLYNLRFRDSSIKFNKTYRVINISTGKTHWIQHKIQDIKRDTKGDLLPEQGVIQDITKYKLAEEKIKRADVILNKVNSIVLAVNRKGYVTYASEGVKTILGFRPKDVLNLGWWKLSFPDKESAQKVKDADYNYFFNKNSSIVPDNEFSLRKIKTKKGKYKWIKWSFTKENENSFIAIGVDVTKSHEKTERYIALTETAHDAIVMANNKGEIIDVNKTAIKMFGYSRKEVLGQSVTSLMPKKDRHFFIEELINSNEKGNRKKSKFKIGKGVNKKGFVFPVEISFNSWSSDNKLTHCAFIKDVTQQKYEEKIKEIIFNITKYAQKRPTLDNLLSFIKESLSTVIDSSTLFVSLYDDSKQVFNSYESTDIKNEKSIVSFSKGNSLFDYVMDNKKSLLYTKSSKIDKNKIKSKCWVGVPLIRKQKTIGVLSLRSYTNKNAYSQKDVSLLEIVASTISQVIQQIKDFEKINLLNQALVQSSAIIMITDIKGDIEYVNPSFTKITGYEPNEVLGKNPRFIGLNKINKSVSSKLWKAISKGKPWEGEFTNIKKNGSVFTVFTTIAPVKNNAKEITHYISVQEDITEKRKLENQFINGFVEAQEIEKRAFGEELHDSISQILSAETMYINVLIQENQDRIDGKAKFLTKIKELNLRAAKETRNIAHGLLSNQLIENGLIKAIENICIDYTNTKDIKFYYYHKNIYEEDLSKEIKINIFRVIQEITTNIVRHSKASEATITLTKIKQNTLNLIIKDNGIGIDYNNKTKKQYNSVGGFENIKRRITLLNGTIDIDTSINNGLCYTINIPM